MITFKEAIEMGIPIVGMEKDPDFVVSSVADGGADKNINLADDIQDLFNKQLKIIDYSEDKIKHLTITFIVISPTSCGVNWKERKHYKRTDKNFYFDIRFPDYEQFCSADRQTALKMMTEQTLRGAKLFLSKEKDFDFPKFYHDVENLFKENNML